METEDEARPDPISSGRARSEPGAPASGAPGAPGAPDSPGAPRKGPGPWTVTLCLALLCAIWGSTYLVIRKGLVDLPPFTAASIRFALAGAVFALLCPWLHAREGGRPPTLRLTLSMGSLNVGACYGVVYWSETVLPSGLVSVLWAVFPLLMAAAGHVWLPGERLSRAQWGGLAIGFGGVVSLFFTDLSSLGPEAVPAGLVLLTSPVVYTLGAVVVKRHGGETSSALLNRNGMLLGSFLLGCAAFVAERDAPLRWSTQAVASIAYLSLLGTVVTFGLYYWLLRYAPATKLSLIAYVIPGIALFLGVAVDGEPAGAHTLVGFAAILAGVAVVHGRFRVDRPR